MLQYNQLADAVHALHNDFTELRERALARYDLYAMRRDPYVPGDIAREGKFRINSPLVMNSAREIRADLMMNPTEFMVIPLARESGAISRPMERRAENLERALAIIWGRLNEGRLVDREIIWHQLVSPFGVMVLEFNEFSLPDQPEYLSDEQYVEFVEAYEREWMPWSVSTPDPLTCSFIEKRGRLVMFARKYRVNVFDLELMYNMNHGSVEPDKRLRLVQDKWRWVSDDYSTEISKNSFREVDMLYLDDGEYIYQAAENLDGTGGMILSCVPNPCGKVAAYIVPGNKTPHRRPEDAFEPFLLPLMQNIMQTNDIRSTRATAARNLAGPHMYIPVDPELQKMYLQKGEKLPAAQRFRKNEIPYLLGQVQPLPSELSPDWDKLEAMVQGEQARLLPSPFVHVLDPAVIKSATATSILHAAESGLRTYGPLMSAYDSAIRDLMEDGIVSSLVRYYDELEVFAYASGEEVARGRNLKQGTLYKLNRDMVDFPHRLLVKTRGMSQAQAAAQYELVERQWVLPDGSKGPASFDDLLDAGNYTDKPAQKIKLAVEGFLEIVKPWLQEMALRTVQEKIQLDGGVNIGLIQQPAMPALPGGAPPAPGAPGGASPAAAAGAIGGGDSGRRPARPNAAQRMDAPYVNPAQGGTESTVLGGPLAVT